MAQDNIETRLEKIADEIKVSALLLSTVRMLVDSNLNEKLNKDLDAVEDLAKETVGHIEAAMESYSKVDVRKDRIKAEVEAIQAERA